jgi:hypothetical protein
MEDFELDPIYEDNEYLSQYTDQGESDDESLYEDDDYLSQFLPDKKETEAARIKYLEDTNQKLLEMQTTNELLQSELEEDDYLDNDPEIQETFSPDYRDTLENSRRRNREVEIENKGVALKINHDAFERVKSYRPIAEAASQRTGVPVSLLLGQIYQESRGRNVISPAGAAGVSQFMPATAKQYGVDVNDVVSSINGQANYMRDLIKHYNGNLGKATMAYNAGQGRIDNYYKGVGKPLKAETINYLPLVNQAADMYKQTGGYNYAQTGVDNSKGYIPMNPQYDDFQNRINNYGSPDPLTPKGYNDNGYKERFNTALDNKIDFKPTSFPNSTLNNQNSLTKKLDTDINTDEDADEEEKDSKKSIKDSDFAKFATKNQDAFVQVASMVQPFLDLGRSAQDFKARGLSNATGITGVMLGSQESNRKRIEEQDLFNLSLDKFNPNSNNRFKERSVLG